MLQVRMQADFKEDQPLAINSRSTDKINPTKSQKPQTFNKAKFKEWQMERRSDIQQFNKHASTQIYKKGEDGWTNTGAPH